MPPGAESVPAPGGFCRARRRASGRASGQRARGGGSQKAMAAAMVLPPEVTEAGDPEDFACARLRCRRLGGPGGRESGPDKSGPHRRGRGGPRGGFHPQFRPDPNAPCNLPSLHPPGADWAFSRLFFWAAHPPFPRGGTSSLRPAPCRAEGPEEGGGRSLFPAVSKAPAGKGAAALPLPSPVEAAGRRRAGKASCGMSASVDCSASRRPPPGQRGTHSLSAGAAGQAGSPPPHRAVCPAVRVCARRSAAALFSRLPPWR